MKNVLLIVVICLIGFCNVSNAQNSSVDVNEKCADALYKYSFDSDPEGWTVIDADGDGFCWDTLRMAAHTGSGCVYSESYNNEIGVMHPDNYFVSPIKYELGNGAKMKLWAGAIDPYYVQEHFGIAISTESNTLASDFTTVAEWTLSSDIYTQYEVILDDYAGEEVWIAIRHFDVSNQYIILVDDVEIKLGESVDVEENAIANMMLYPNPVKDNMTISAEDMKRISVVNTLGQIIYDQEVLSDNVDIDMSQYEAGVYLVRITTETGVATKRVVVAK